MATITTAALTIPPTSLGIVVEHASKGVLPQLSPERPTLFGPVQGAVFTDVPRAEVVGESEAKHSTDVSMTPFKADPIKLQTSVRTSNEFMWADNDYRLGVMSDAIAPAIGNSISRAVDLLAFHGINPATGQVTPRMPVYLSQTTNVVTAAGKPTSEVVDAVGLTLNGVNGGMPTGVAFDGAFGFSMATEINPQTGTRLNQGMNLSGAMSSWEGLNAVSGTTISGRPELADTGIRAIVGDWSQVRWGFQRQIPLEVIEYGDPDNTGRDLKGHNEVLIRVEAVVYIAIRNLNRFAMVKATVA